MTPTAAILVSALGGYLSGSLPFGYWAGKLKGIDIRQHGSGNIGATNVIRVLGKGIGIPVFILDALKGWLPAWLAGVWVAQQGAAQEIISAAAVVAGLAAVLGHMFTFWLSFKGGKGVATTAGVLLGIAPLAMLGGLIVWLLFFFTTRYVSLASMMAGVGVVATMATVMGRNGQWDLVMLGFGILIMGLVIVRHRSNISRLLAGTESKAGRKKA
ncbi:glycerol-3-phosphate acyltransferase PlsY [Prosthecobacter debontii]|uniref:Glycerol-3-phosphate acyltransferase n=1 Tax=Prosthecobacter debontii TaxID=48467 RepID=A0A1T4YMD5_9BACT|nr:glycerol-3-phosphate 1-O-acyltransferase PlsY [Prosthecobacter debontii]SKB02718.1 glycerol-3-phosphate acyltransferase PlsY [Prosthecobacter debontii]